MKGILSIELLLLSMAALGLHGCTFDPISWGRGLATAGWSNTNLPIVIEYVPTGIGLHSGGDGLIPRLGPTGGHYEIKYQNKEKVAFNVPSIRQAMNMTILDDDTILIVGRHGKGDVFAERFNITTKAAEGRVSVSYDYSRRIAKRVIFSDDLRFLAMATKAGIVVKDLRSNDVKTYIPEFRVSEILFSRDSQRLACYVRANETALQKYPFLTSTFSGIQLMNVDGNPSDRLPPDTPNSYVGFLVIDLRSGDIVGMQSCPSPHYNDFRDDSYPGGWFMFEFRVHGLPFYFHPSDQRLTPLDKDMYGLNRVVIGPSISPDGGKLGFIKQGKNLEWIELHSGIRHSIEVASNGVDPYQ